MIRSVVIGGIRYKPEVVPKPSSKSLGKRLAEIRISKRISQPKAAELARVHVNTVSFYERDKIIPKVDVLLDIMRAMKATDEEIIYILKGTRP